ncbi:MAG: hypothetical protein IMZ63_03865 [Actinobacteria bacterium]|nr:hypothetical protein [Actinomycetota bacterium]
MFKWTTKEGKELKLNEIEDNHLLNILKMLRRLKENGILRISGDIWGDDIDAWEDDEWLDEDEKVLKIIRKEVKKRGLRG